MTEIYLVLELSQSCNLDCLYCYNIWKEPQAQAAHEMDYRRALQVIERMRSACFIGGITYTGGEPLLCRDLFLIAAEVQRLGLPQSITTNGMLVGPDEARKLKESGFAHAEVSIPSVNEELYRKICGGGSLKQARAAVLHMAGQKIRCSVSAVLTALNHQELREMIGIAAALGAGHFLLNRFVAGGRGLKFRNELDLSRQQLQEVLETAERASADFRIPVIVNIPMEHCLYSTADLKHLHFSSCECGRFKWLAGADGLLRTCEQNPETIGNILEEEADFLMSKKITGDFRARNLFADCESKPCYTRCGGGCRFVHTN